eukprot:6177562-Pleurochrysis_carterae.AAC.3
MYVVAVNRAYAGTHYMLLTVHAFPSILILTSVQNPACLHSCLDSSRLDRTGFEHTLELPNVSFLHSVCFTDMLGVAHQLSNRGAYTLR